MYSTAVYYIQKIYLCTLLIPYTISLYYLLHTIFGNDNQSIVHDNIPSIILSGSISSWTTRYKSNRLTNKYSGRTHLLDRPSLSLSDSQWTQFLHFREIKWTAYFVSKPDAKVIITSNFIFICPVCIVSHTITL